MKCPICKEEVGDEDAICDACGYVLDPERLSQMVKASEPAPEPGKKKFTSIEEIASLFSDIEEPPVEEVEETAVPPAPEVDEKELQIMAATGAQEILMEAHEARGFGVDTKRADALIDNVRGALQNRRYRVAIGLVDEARSELEKARVERDNYVNAANLAQEAVAEMNRLRQEGIDTSEARKFIDLGKAAMRNRDYDGVVKFIASARQSMEDAIKSIKVIQELKLVKAKLVELQGYGLDMTRAEKLFRDARVPLEKGNFDEALDKAVFAREYAIQQLLKRQMQAMEIVKESTDGLEKAEGTFVLDEEDEEFEVGEGELHNAGKPDAYLKLKADFENYRRLSSDKVNEMREFANMEIIANILDVVDNFDRALGVHPKDMSASSVTSFMDGMAAIHKQLVDTLKEEGVASIEAMGEEFDPFLHEAVESVATDRFPEDIVIEEIQKGYMMKDKVIRPSKVKVSRSVK